MRKAELLARIVALEARITQLEARPYPTRQWEPTMPIGPRPAYPPGYFTPYSTGTPPLKPPIVTCTHDSGSIIYQR